MNDKSFNPLNANSNNALIGQLHRNARGFPPLPRVSSQIANGGRFSHSQAIQAMAGFAQPFLWDLRRLKKLRALIAAASMGQPNRLRGRSSI
jgi:hypothetical protein